MKALVQRVLSGYVEVDQKKTADIQQGIVILLGISKQDSQKDVAYLCNKISSFKFFSDGEDSFKFSLLDTGFSAIVVSQFTLYANTKKGTKPSFTEAMQPDDAKILYDQFCQQLISKGVKVQTGVFQAYMHVGLVNDGPITLEFNSDKIQ